MNKKGMEMWVLVMMILALLFFVLIVIWYGGLGTSLGDLFKKIGEMW